MMEVKEYKIPHIFRNKYLRGGSASYIGGANTVIPSSGDEGGGSSSHSQYADLAEEAKRLSEYVSVYGNMWRGDTDLFDISATTIVATSAEIDNFFSKYANVKHDLHVSGDTFTQGNSSISGNTQIGGNTEIGGYAHIGGSASVTGDINTSGNTFTEGSATVHHDFTAGGKGIIYGPSILSGGTTTTDIHSENITNTGTIRTKDLEVTGTAHFFELIIDKIKAAGGAVLLTPADGFKIDKVETVTNGKKLYFRSTDNEGKGILNMWKVGDQAICQSFNEARVGVSYDVSNKYWWSLVTDVDEEPVQTEIDGETQDCHYIVISTQQGYDGNGVPYYDGTINCEVGDEVAMLGYRGTDEPQRQSAIYIAAYRSVDLGLTAPHFAEYQGIDDFNLASHRRSYIDANGAKFVGALYVDVNTSVQDYIDGETTEIRNEFRFDMDGLTSKVEHKSRPNIIAANDWHDQDDRDVYQDNDEQYDISGTTECIGYPSVMYLNADTYTFSICGYGKFKTIQYGQTKDNLDRYLPVETMVNYNDVWKSQPRSQTIFIAPIDGYYKLGVELMDSSYSGDTPYIDYIDEQSSGDTSATTIETSIELEASDVKVNRISATEVEVYPQDYSGNIIYRSSNPSAVQVDENGNITGVGQGNATIYAYIPEAYSGGYHYLPSESYTSVQCTESGATTVTLVMQNGFLSGETGTLLSAMTPSDYPGTVTYSSSNPSVLEVNGTSVTAKSIGFATITVYAPEVEIDGYKWLSSTDSKSVEVRDFIRVNPQVNINVQTSVRQGDYISPQITITPSIVDYSTYSTGVIEADGDGYRATRAGTGAICVQTIPTVSGEYYYKATSASTEITCVATGQTSCSISTDTNVIYSGYTTANAVISINPSTSMQHTFSSSNTSVATVDNNCVITPTGLGSCNIILTVQDQIYNNVFYYGSSASTQVTCSSATTENLDIIIEGSSNPVVMTTKHDNTPIRLGDYVDADWSYLPQNYNPSGITYNYTYNLSGVTLNQGVMTVKMPDVLNRTYNDTIWPRVTVSGSSQSIVTPNDYHVIKPDSNEVTFQPTLQKAYYHVTNTRYGTAINTSGWGCYVYEDYNSSTGYGNATFYANPTKTPAECFDSLPATADRLLYVDFSELVNVTVIGSRSFYEEQTLYEFAFPPNVVTIESEAFYRCLKLPEINIPSGVTSIGYRAFGSCEKLTSITIPSGVTEIIQATFYNCASLTGVTLSNQTTTIGKEAFSTCVALPSITIPSSVTSIGDYAFQYCIRMEDVTILATTPPTLGTKSMDRAKATQSDRHFGTLHVPSQSVSAYQAISGYSNYFSNIVAI